MSFHLGQKVFAYFHVGAIWLPATILTEVQVGQAMGLWTLRTSSGETCYKFTDDILSEDAYATMLLSQ